MTLREEYEGIRVVREDLYCGLLPNGKLRALLPRFAELKNSGVQAVVNAGATHSNSHAVVAAAAGAIGLRAITVVNSNKPHPHTALAAELGAEVVYTAPSHLGPLWAKARQQVKEHTTMLLPWGLADERFIYWFSMAVNGVPSDPRNVHVVPLGAGGCAAGIYQGLRQAGREERVVAVAVMPTSQSNDEARVRKWFAQSPGLTVVPSPGLTGLPFRGDPRYEGRAWPVARQLRDEREQVVFWNIGQPLCA